MTYSTEPNVRNEAWFDWNADLTTDVIDRYQLQSYNIIRWVVAWRYDITLLDSSNPNFVWSQASYYLARVEELMAAWYILIKEFWSDWTERKETGELKLKEANSLLDKLFWSPATRLVGLDWNEITTVPIASAWSIDSNWMVWRDRIFTTTQIF